jgi:cell division protein FtsQ
VYGIHHAAPEEVQQVVMPLVDRGYFTIHLDHIRDHLLQLSWISNVSVRKIWPDQVELTIHEKMPIAIWNKESLLSENGVLFSPKQASYLSSLPTFIGSPGQQIVMLNVFKDMSRLLVPLHVKIAHLELTSYLTWKLKLDNGMMMQIGYNDVLTQLNRFVKVYPKVIGTHASDVEYVDLRYPNGVAVRWKTTFAT